MYGRQKKHQKDIDHRLEATENFQKKLVRHCKKCRRKTPHETTPELFRCMVCGKETAIKDEQG